jgi:APA family basic amino acid/polyamine antiporter
MTQKLIRGLTYVDAAALVVGTIIGTGIFLKSATMAQQTGSPGMVLLVWVLAGLLSLAGALTYAEIGALFPRAGGEYVFLREAYGDVPAFLYGWMRFAIGSPGSIAAYAVGAATFLQGAVSLDAIGGTTGAAFFFIVIFTGLNCFQVKVGGRVNSVLTSLKVCMVLALVVGIVFFSDSFAVGNLAAPDEAAAFTMSGLGLAMLSALWAYDGWNNMPMAAGEVENPQRNVPRALVTGVLLVVAVYLLVNLAYFLALPFSEVITANSDLHADALPIATKAAQTFLGVAGIGAISFLFVVSALGAMNGSILTSARIPYAMANDNLFFKQLGVLHAGSHVPVTSLILQGIVASILAFMGTFNQLTDYVMFASWLFYALVAASIFIFRKRLPHAERSYKVWGYPVLPIVFIVVAALLIANTVLEMPKQSLIGVGIILLGIPLHYFLKARRGLTTG